MDEKYEHINDLVIKTKSGDTDSLFELFKFYKPLLYSSIKRCIIKDPRLSVHREDMFEESLFVLQKIIKQYDPDLTYFSYFISTRIDINLFRHVSEKYIKEEDRIQNNFSTEVSYDPFNKIDTIISIQNAMELLSDEEAEVIKLYFFDQYSQQESAEMLGITQGAFSKKLSKTLEQLKSILGDDFLLD
jgi:RNA polymerase sigma-70 factor (ECF subfamily)